MKLWSPCRAAIIRKQGKIGQLGNYILYCTPLSRAATLREKFTGLKRPLDLRLKHNVTTAIRQLDRLFPMAYMAKWTLSFPPDMLGFKPQPSGWKAYKCFHISNVASSITLSANPANLDGQCAPVPLDANLMECTNFGIVWHEKTAPTFAENRSEGWAEHQTSYLLKNSTN